MGFTLEIGEAQIMSHDDEQSSSYYLGVREEKHENGLIFGEPTDTTNSRWPSYTNWAACMRDANMYDLFYNDDYGLVRNGCSHHMAVPITEWHIKTFDRAYKKYKQKHPDAKPTYETKRDEDAVLVRLEWLNYWLHWAFENCENPSFYAS